MEMQHDERARRIDLYSDEGHHMGTIEYARIGLGKIAAMHTEVFSPYKGQGLGALLVDELAAFAHKRGLRILPACNYVEDTFLKQPAKYASVL